MAFVRSIVSNPGHLRYAHFSLEFSLLSTLTTPTDVAPKEKIEEGNGYKAGVWDLGLITLGRERLELLRGNRG